MAQNKKQLITVPEEHIIRQIYLIRGKKVMLDRDLAKLYGVTTGNLNKAVRRNIKRFPTDFMFQLTKEEMRDWIFQFGTSNKEKMGMRKPPLAFTEHGASMLSSVLSSERAIQVNIQIIRTFAKLREMLTSYKSLKDKIEAMERDYDEKFAAVFAAIKQLMTEEEKSKREIGFKPQN